MLFRPLQAIALLAALPFFLPAHAVDSCNWHGNANLNQNTRTTIPGSECGDEGYFSGWGTLMMLWPNKAQNTYNIVRRYAPELDTNGDGEADSKDRTGYPHLVNRIWLEQKWVDENGSAGFPLNLKSENLFNEFLTHLEGNGYGQRCVFDLNGCMDTSSNVQTDPAIPTDKECPVGFYGDKICASGPDATETPTSITELEEREGTGTPDTFSGTCGNAPTQHDGCIDSIYVPNTPNHWYCSNEDPDYTGADLNCFAGESTETWMCYGWEGPWTGTAYSHVVNRHSKNLFSKYDDIQEELATNPPEFTYYPCIAGTECYNYFDFDYDNRLYAPATGILPNHKGQSLVDSDGRIDVTLYWDAITRWPQVPTNLGPECTAAVGLIASLRRPGCNICGYFIGGGAGH